MRRLNFRFESKYFIYYINQQQFNSSQINPLSCLLLNMIELNANTKFIFQMASECFSSIDRSVLATGTTKTHHQVGESAFNILLNGNVHDIEYAVEEVNHFCSLLQEIPHFFVFPMIFFVFFESSRIEYSPAIKHKTATVAGNVSGNTFLVTKTVDGHNEWSVVISLKRNEPFDDFICNTNLQHPSELRNRDANILTSDEFL